jgi:hypothetical protein
MVRWICVTKGTSNSGAAESNVTAVAYYVKWMKKEKEKQESLGRRWHSSSYWLTAKKHKG